MDKLLVRKDVYEELLEKGFGKRDLSKLTKKKITDKNGHTRTVYVRNEEQPKRNRKSTDMETMIYEDMKQHVPGYETDDLMSKRVNNMNTIDEYEKLFSKMAANGINAKRDRPDLYEIYAAAKGNLRAINEELKARNNQRLNNAKQIGKKQSNVKEGLSDEKRAKYEKMLEKVKAGSDENALFVGSKGMLNKKDAIAYLEGKLGKKSVSSAAQGHLESDTPQNTDITAEDEARFGKQALSGLSGKRTAEPKHTLEVGSEVKFKRTGQPIKIKKIEQYGDTKVVVGEYDYKGKKEENRFRLDELDYEEEKPEQKKEDNPIAIGNTVKYKRTGQPIKIKDIETYGNDKVIVGEYEHNGKTETNRFRMDEISTEPTQDDMKENYLDAKNEGGKDIADENRIDTHFKNAINLNDSEVKKMQKVFDYIPENATASQIMNTIYDEDKALYKKLSEMDIEYKKLHPEAEGKTFGFDLATKYLEDSFNEYKKDHEVGKDKFAEMSVEDIRKEQQNLLDDYNQYYNAYKNGKNDGSKLREYFKKFDVYKTALDKKSKE